MNEFYDFSSVTLKGIFTGNLFNFEKHIEDEILKFWMPTQISPYNVVSLEYATEIYFPPMISVSQSE